MGNQLKGTAWKFGDNINADNACQFFKNMNIDLNDQDALAKICMTGYDPDFPKKAKEGDFIVGGKNFGSGHMHAHFYYSIKALGIRAIIAESVSHRMCREGVNSGLHMINCPSTDPIENGDLIVVDPEQGMITIERSKKVIRFFLSSLHKEIIDQGGIDSYIKSRLDKTL